VSVNCPWPSVVVVMLVPTIFTMTDAVASVPALETDAVASVSAVLRVVAGRDDELT